MSVQFSNSTTTTKSSAHPTNLRTGVSLSCCQGTSGITHAIWLLYYALYLLLVINTQISAVRASWACEDTLYRSCKMPRKCKMATALRGSDTPRMGGLSLRYVGLFNPLLRKIESGLETRVKLKAFHGMLTSYACVSFVSPMDGLLYVTGI